MQILAIQRILGILLSLSSTTMLPPIAVSLFYHDGSEKAFMVACIVLFVTGIL